MFDFFLVCDFDRAGRERKAELKFSALPAYREIRFREHAFRFGGGYAVLLERNEKDRSFLSRGGVHYFLYGSIFTNRKFQQEKNQPPHKVRPEELAAIYGEWGEGMVGYLKGSFVLAIADEKSPGVKVITDRLNVLPLYYCFKDRVLVLSSSVRMILNTGFPSRDLDPQALAELSLFDYMLRGRHFFREIRQAENGRIYTFDGNGTGNRAYWSVEELYHERLLPREESLERLSAQLFENVGLYTSDRKKALVSFTGGFDGRTNVAMLRKPREDYLCYSYGMPGSNQIEIPREICGRLDIPYRPVYLDGTYENEYEACAGQAVEFSNGTAPAMRANYPFAYKRLREFSDLILTGLFGSEILRPLHNLGIQINDQSEAIFLGQDFREAIRMQAGRMAAKKYMRPDRILGSIDGLIESFRSDYFDRYGRYDRVTRFFFFIIQEGIRKYFMQEVQIERAFVTTRFPYFDDDLVDLIYRTTFAGMYNGFLGKSKVKRRKGQLLYAHIIRKYKPELGKFALDRCYTSDDLLRPFPLNYIHLTRGVYEARRNLKKYGNTTFDSKRWTRDFFQQSLEKNVSSGLWDEGLKGSFQAGSYLSDLLSFAHMISLREYTGE